MQDNIKFQNKFILPTAKLKVFPNKIIAVNMIDEQMKTSFGRVTH